MVLHFKDWICFTSQFVVSYPMYLKLMHYCMIWSSIAWHGIALPCLSDNALMGFSRSDIQKGQNLCSWVYSVWLKMLILLDTYCLYFRSVEPEAGIKGMDKQLHPNDPIDTVGCNYLSLPLIPASGTTLYIFQTQLYCHRGTRTSIIFLQDIE